MSDQMPLAIDPILVPVKAGTDYPEEFAANVKARERRKLGDAFGLTNFGVNFTTLPPGCWSSQRHWHSKQDEFVYIVSGELVLVTDAGEQVITAGMVAGFPAGKPDGHHLINKSSENAVYLEIGDRIPMDTTQYSDIDMRTAIVDENNTDRYVHKDGTPYKA